MTRALSKMCASQRSQYESTAQQPRPLKLHANLAEVRGLLFVTKCNRKSTQRERAINDRMKSGRVDGTDHVLLMLSAPDNDFLQTHCLMIAFVSQVSPGCFYLATVTGQCAL